MIELVNTTTGERVNLLYVDGLHIELGGVSPDVYAEFKRLDYQRRLYREFIDRPNTRPCLSAEALMRGLVPDR